MLSPRRVRNNRKAVAITGYGAHPKTATEASVTRVPMSAAWPTEAGVEQVLNRYPLEPTEVAGLRRPFPDNLTLMAIVAVDAALAELGGDFVGDGTRVGMVFNTCFGPNATVEKYLNTLGKEGPAAVSPITFSRTVANAPSGEISRRHNLRGPSSVTMGHSSIIYGVDLIASDHADAMICVGADEIRPLTLWGFRQTGLFDFGLQLGDGAAAVVCEDVERCYDSGRTPLAIVASTYLSFCSTIAERVQPIEEDAIFLAMTDCLESCAGAQGSIGCVIGASTEDTRSKSAEKAAFERLFTGSVDYIRPKRITGETMGASECMAVGEALNVLTNLPDEKSVLVLGAQLGGTLSCILLKHGGK